MVKWALFFIGSNENWFKKYPLESNLVVFCKNLKPFKDLINPLFGTYIVIIIWDIALCTIMFIMQNTALFIIIKTEAT